MSEEEKTDEQKNVENPEPQAPNDPAEPTPDSDNNQGESPPNPEADAENNSDVDQRARSQDDAQMSMDGPDGPNDDLPKKRRRKLVTKKNKKPGFSLADNINLPVNEYNALKDSHLQSFFVNDRVRKHLRKMYLITKEGYIVEKPEEYRRNRQLLRQHYASQSVGNVGRGDKKKSESMPYGNANGTTTTKKAKKGKPNNNDSELNQDEQTREDVEQVEGITDVEQVEPETGEQDQENQPEEVVE